MNQLIGLRNRVITNDSYPFSTNGVCNSATGNCTNHSTNGHNGAKHGILKNGSNTYILVLYYHRVSRIHINTILRRGKINLS